MDSTYLKQEGKPLLYFIGINGEESNVEVGLNKNFIKPEPIDKPAIQVPLLFDGKSSKELSSISNISKQTVDPIRKKSSIKTISALRKN